MDREDAQTIGLAIWRVRDDRGKSLRVVAGLAGMSKDTLNRIERGLRSPTLSEVLALAEVLQISVSELTSLPVPAPANGHTDSTTDGVRLALDAIDVDHPGGLVLPVAVLRHRVAQIQQHSRACRFAEVAAELPGLIRDLHTTLATGIDHGELLGLAVHLHVHVTRLWLVHAAAPTDLVRRSVFLARHLAQEHGEVSMLGMAGFAVADVLLNGGAPELGNIELDSFTLPTTAGTAGLVGLVTTTRALAAILAGRPGDAVAPMDAAAEIYGRFEATGETDLLGFPLASTNVEFRRVRLALEAKEPDRAVSIAQNVHPERHPYPVGQAQYWVNYGRALAQLRGRHHDAARALRNAERIHPHRVRRDPFARDTLAVLLRQIRCRLTKDEDRLIFDLRGTSPQAPGPINCARAALEAAVLGVVLSFLCYDLPWTLGGVNRVVEIVSEEGTVNNAVSPAPISMASIMGTLSTQDAAAGAMAQMLLCSEKYRGEAQATWSPGISTGSCAGRSRRGEY